MSNEQIEITNENMQTFFQETGLDLFATPDVGTTRAGQRRMKVDGKVIEKGFVLDDHNGLKKVEEGDTGFLVTTMAKVLTIPGSFSATELLRENRMRVACVTAARLDRELSNNVFMQRLTGESPDSITVFYGSTAGINFSEALETTLAALKLRDLGHKVNVLFDYEDIASEESNLIFQRSMQALPQRLRERVSNFINQRGGSLMQSRLDATRSLLGVADNGEFPTVRLIDELEVFNQLAENFTVGQMLMMARMAGNDPRVFKTKDGVIFKASELLEAELPEPFRFVSPADLLKQPVAEVLSRGLQPQGFTFYAREARIGRFSGAFGSLLKLTDKADIYKILIPSGSLFDNRTGNGMLLFPITRNKIQIGRAVRSDLSDDRPVDPVVLKILAEDQPAVFSGIMNELTTSFSVFTPNEAIKAGTADRKVFIKEQFNLEEEI